jgi:hypothetical protein
MKIWVLKFRNHAAQTRLFLKHLDPSNNSVSKKLRPLWAVLGNKPHQIPQIALRCPRPDYSVSHAAICFLTVSCGMVSPRSRSLMPF